MLLIGLKNIGIQDLAADELLGFGAAYRRYCKKDACGVPTFSSDATSLTLNQKGIYHLTAVITFTAPVAGDVTFQLLENGVVIPGALATETITTATTEIKTTTLDYYILVDNTILFGALSSTPKVITIQNTGVASTVSNVVLNVTKEV